MTPTTLVLVKKLIEAIADIDFDETEEPLTRQVAELIGFAGAVKLAIQEDLK